MGREVGLPSCVNCFECQAIHLCPGSHLPQPSSEAYQATLFSVIFMPPASLC